jgi:putative two-component system response regulator
MSRILVIDDEAVIRDLMGEILEEAGYEAVGVDAAARGLELLEEDGFALVVSDIVMPGFSGLELLEELRKRHPSLPVILTTGAGTYDKLSEALAGGADALLVKPFSHAELQSAVEKVFERKQLSESALRERLLTPTVAATLADAIEARNGAMYGHCERIAEVASRLALAIGLDDRDAEAVRLGAILHDVGKIGIPDLVLLKPGPLTPEELALIRTHTVLGDQLLEPLDLLREVRPIVRHHHERWDGCGYPDGLAAEEIPLAARIVAVADAAEAMSAPRAYREPIGRTQIVRQLQEGSGKQWDPALVELTLDLIRRGELVFGPDGLQVRQPIAAGKHSAMFSILLVEDDPDHALLASTAIEAALDDVRVVHARDVRSAVELCRGATWSLALLDYRLPDGTGLDVLEALREVAPGVPTVMITAEGSESVAVEAFRQGANDYVVKGPGYLTDLTNRVQALVEAA